MTAINKGDGADRFDTNQISRQTAQVYRESSKGGTMSLHVLSVLCLARRYKSIQMTSLHVARTYT